MVQVNAKPDETIDDLLKRFKEAVNASGILTEYRRKEYFEKPSVVRRRKEAAARKQALKNNSKRRPKPKKTNWKWNKSRTKKIPMDNNREKPQQNRSSGQKPINFSKPLTKEQIDRALKRSGFKSQQGKNWGYKGKRK